MSKYNLGISLVIHKLLLYIPAFLVLLSFFSVYWSQNQIIALYKSIKILEFYLLYLYIIYKISPLITNCSTWNNYTNSNTEESTKTNIASTIVPRGTFFIIIILLGLLQSIVGIIQFITQKSIGLFWLKESLVSPETLGVAKIILGSEKFIRSYGLMPHPNILGGFLLFSIIVTLLYKKLFHACLPDRQVEHFEIFSNDNSIVKNTLVSLKNTHYQKNIQIVPRGTFLNYLISILDNCSTWNKLNKYNLINIILYIQILGLFLTFSKSAIIGLIIAINYINFQRLKSTSTSYFTSACVINKGNIVNYIKNIIIHTKEIVPRGTIKIYLLLSSIIIISILFLIKPDLNSIFIKSLNERISFLIVPRGTISQNPILGIGSGQAVLSMQKFYPKTLKFWEYQPTHNVFLIIWSELGIIGLILFIWWLWKLFKSLNYKIVPRGTITNNKTGSEQLVSNHDKPTSSVSDVLSLEEDKSILNNNNVLLSNIISLHYFKGILLGFIFIMLFDHYFWDIQQGSLLFWLIAGFVAGINKK